MDNVFAHTTSDTFIFCGKALTKAQKFSVKFAGVGKWIKIHWTN